MNLDYCNKKCPIGISASKEILNESESIFDAVLDFNTFVDKCYQACPYKDEHKMEESN